MSRLIVAFVLWAVGVFCAYGKKLDTFAGFDFGEAKPRDAIDLDFSSVKYGEDFGGLLTAQYYIGAWGLEFPVTPEEVGLRGKYRYDLLRTNKTAWALAFSNDVLRRMIAQTAKWQASDFDDRYPVYDWLPDGSDMSTYVIRAPKSPVKNTTWRTLSGANATSIISNFYWTRADYGIKNQKCYRVALIGKPLRQIFCEKYGGRDFSAESAQKAKKIVGKRLKGVADDVIEDVRYFFQRNYHVSKVKVSDVNPMLTMYEVDAETRQPRRRIELFIPTAEYFMQVVITDVALEADEE